MKSAKVLIAAVLMSMASNVAFAQQMKPSRAAVIQTAGQLTVVSDDMSVFAQRRGYPNTSNDLSEIMTAAMQIEQAARFYHQPAEAQMAYNQIVRTWYEVRQRINTICRYYSVNDCYYIRNNVRSAINNVAGALGQTAVKVVSANTDDAPLREIPVRGGSWAEDGSSDEYESQPQQPTEPVYPSEPTIPGVPAGEPYLTPGTNNGWNP